MKMTFPAHHYADAPATQAHRFRCFREQHPHTRITVHGAHWSYIDAGDGEETILLLPGGIRVAEAWFKAIQVLEREYRVLCPSYPPLETMDAYVAGLHALLQHAGVEQVHVAGNSFGGWLAQCFVRKHPRRVRSMILSSTSGPEGFPLWLVRLARALVEIYPTTLTRFGLKRNFLKLIDPPADERAFWTGFVNELLAETTREEAAAQYAMTDDFVRNYQFSPDDLWGWPGRILIIESEHDMGIMQKAQPALRRLYPQAQIYALQGAGHTAAYVDPSEYLSVLRDFVDRIRRTAKQEAP